MLPAVIDKCAAKLSANGVPVVLDVVNSHHPTFTQHSVANRLADIGAVQTNSANAGLVVRVYDSHYAYDRPLPALYGSSRMLQLMEQEKLKLTRRDLPAAAKRGYDISTVSNIMAASYALIAAASSDSSSAAARSAAAV